MKVILKRQGKILSCLVFLLGIVSCHSNPSDIVPCHIAPSIQLEPPEGIKATTTPLGAFTFHLNDAIDTYFENGVNIKLDFNSSIDSVGFIQIVRTVNLCDGRFLYPSLEKRKRATLEGWYIDRREGSNWAIFGQRNDGGFEHYISTGKPAEAKPAYIEDRPYRPEGHPFLGIRWQAVSVPVDLTTSGTNCENRRLGYYYWSWVVTENGSLVDIKHGDANSSLIGDVDAALLNWKSQQHEECIAAPLVLTHK